MPGIYTITKNITSKNITKALKFLDERNLITNAGLMRKEIQTKDQNHEI